MRYLLLVLTVFIFSPFISSAEQIKFNVFLFHDKIGETIVTRERNPDGSEKYVLESNLKAKVLWINKEVHTYIEAVYKNNKLISSVYKEVENGKLTQWNNVQYDGSKYTVDGYKGKRTFSQSPTFSVLSVYVNGLTVTDRIFDEGEADFKEFVHTDKDTWEFKDDTGRNVYFMQNGKLQKAEFHATIATVTIVRAN